MILSEKSWLNKASNWLILWANWTIKTMSFSRLMADSSLSKLSWLRRTRTSQLCKKTSKDSTCHHLSGNLSLRTLTEKRLLFVRTFSKSKVSWPRLRSKIELYSQSWRLLKCISRESTKKKTNSRLNYPK